MPVIADSSYQSTKAGGALENAAEEILNGIFCHYEPPTSTKAQKNAAKAVRQNPTKFLYEEQPAKPILRKKPVATTPNSDYESGSEYYDTETDKEFEEEDNASLRDKEEETLRKVEPETPSKRGIKWRDEESKRREEEKATAKATSRWSQCITLPCFTTDAQEVIPGTLEDIHDENEAPSQAPTPVGNATPTKSALKKKQDGVMRVLYDDEGNPNTTPRSPGSIKNHSFFRNVTNSPRASAYSPRAQFYEPKDYNQPSTPKDTAFQMPRDFTPRPKSNFYPASPSNVGVPSPAHAAVQSPAHADVPLPAPPTPVAAVREIPASPMRVSYVPGSSGVTEYEFSQSIAAPPQRIHQIGLLPGSPGIKDQHGGPQVIRLAKVGRNAVHVPPPVHTFEPAQPWTGVDPAMAQTGTYVAKSPKSYMAPMGALPVQHHHQPTGDIEEPAQISVMQAVQMLNKAGFNPSKRFNRGFNAKSFKIKAPPKSPSAVQHHGYATTQNDNRESLEGEFKPSFVGTRRVAPPTSLVANNAALLKEIKRVSVRTPALELDTTTGQLDELEMARDPTPRQLKIRELEDNLRQKGSALPPTPRRKQEDEQPKTRPTPTAQKPPQHFVPANSNATSSERVVSKKQETTKKEEPKKKKEEKKQEEKKKEEKKAEAAAPERRTPAPSTRPQSRQSRQQAPQQPQQQKKKKGFMSGLKKGLGKLKNTVNEIDSQRIAEPQKKKSGGGGARREIRMA